jgi:hypothetical protein
MITSAAIKNNTIRTVDIRNNTIRSADIGDNAVRSVDIVESTVRSRDIHNNTVRGVDVKDGSLTAADFSGGMRGARGPAGPAGAPGTDASKTVTMRTSGAQEVTVNVGDWTATGTCRSSNPPGGDAYRDYMMLAGPQGQPVIVTNPLRDYEQFYIPRAFFAAGAEQRTLQVVLGDGSQGATVVGGRYRDGDDCVMILTLVANP